MNAQPQPNRLIGETSPYLLAHAHNPVDWYPWGEAAFAKARREDKPVFLSVGYSACHWCHVMARECFENRRVAERLNRDFISVKVDREERPDVDGVYQRACQALSGGGGWPLSVFMTADGEPFHAGTYYPPDAFLALLDAAADAWRHGRAELLRGGKLLAGALSDAARQHGPSDRAPIREATVQFRETFDKAYGGFGRAPKFPSPHSLMFLLHTAPELAEKTLEGMYRGGIFDHIGGGFSRYSTDRQWLVPHFEKMLGDNALLSITYLLAYEATGRPLYRAVAERTLSYMKRELRAPDGGFCSSQDADAQGAEGSYYLFTPEELKRLLGDEAGTRFCRRYDISAEGNFEGKSVPNLLAAPLDDPETDALIPAVYEYRKRRMPLCTDAKRLTAWNALAIAAYAAAYRILGTAGDLDLALEADTFFGRKLADGAAVFAGFAGGRRSGPGFLDDYAFYLFALLQLHQATLEERYLLRAAELADRVWDLFRDEPGGGFFFSGTANEPLVSRVKETWDGAAPSGNSVMAYCLSRLALLTENARFAAREQAQRRFMNGAAAAYPAGVSFYLWSALPVKKIVCAPKGPAKLPLPRIHSDWAFLIKGNDPAYPPLNNETTYYVCENGVCRPPVNRL